MNKVSIKQIKTALVGMGYHKVEAFISRCQVEDGGPEISGETVKEVAWSMLDRDLEAQLLSKLGIA